MRRNLCRKLTLATCLMSAACGGGGGGATEDSSGPDSSLGDEGPVGPWVPETPDAGEDATAQNVSDAGVDDIFGRYTFRSHASVELRAIGQTIAARFEHYGLADIEQGEDGPMLRVQLCRTLVPVDPRDSDLDVVLEIDDRVPESTPVALAPLEITETTAGLSWKAKGLRFAQGYSDDPAVSGIPETSGDTRVSDDDGDGHPGVTLRVIIPGLEIELYAVLRFDVGLEGSVVGTMLEGEQLALTSLGVLEHSLDLSLPPFGVNYDAEGDHSVRLQPTDSALDCQGLLEQFDSHF